MDQLYQQVAAGIANGAIYACVALALVMVFVSTDHINFAQGEMAMFSTFLCWAMIMGGADYWVAFAIAVAVSFVGGLVIERVVLRPLHNAPVLSVIVTFIGLLTIFHSMAGALWKHSVRAFPSPFPKVKWSLSSFISSHQLGMIAVALILLSLLYVFFRFTRLGLAMRAAAQNPASARLVGVRVDWMLALGWGLAAACGAVAGVMIAPVIYLDPNMMSGILLYGFAGALLGGINSPGGAVLGGFIVGIIENVVAHFGTELQNATGIYMIGNSEKLTVALIIVITVLIFRPSGLFGRIAVKRV